MLYVVPSLGVSVVMTSDPSEPSGRTGYVRELHALLTDRILPALGPERRTSSERPSGRPL
jgi:hypothetical protein